MISVVFGTADGEVTDLSDTESLVVTASAPITRTDFYVDDELKEADSSAPYGYDWDTTEVVNGAHQLKALVYYPKHQVLERKLDVTVTNYTVLPEESVTEDVPEAVEE